MRQLLRVFGRAFQEDELYAEAPPADSYIARLLSEESCIVLAALSGDAVVGGIIAYVLPKFEMERSEIYLYDLAVAEESRRQGIASQLIEELKALGRQIGAYVIFVQADREDLPAIRLYETLAQAKEEPFHFEFRV